MKRGTFLLSQSLFLTALVQAMSIGNVRRLSGSIAREGGAFVLAYIVALFAWGAPLIKAEVLIGAKAGKGTVVIFRETLGEEYSWMGRWMVFVCFALGAYYSVIVGWTLRFFAYGLQGGLGSGADANLLWDSFISSPWEVGLFHFIATALAGAMLFHKINGRWERFMRWMLLCFLTLWLSGAVLNANPREMLKGLRDLLGWDFRSLFSAKLWLDALVQSAWATGAGWGFMTALYEATEGDSPLGNNLNPGLVSGVAGILAVLLSAIVMISAGQYEARHQGLIFLGMSKLYADFPAGAVARTLLFLGMSLLAVTTLGSIFEVVIKSFTDAGWTRKNSTALVIVGSFVAGLPSAINVDFMINQDQVWGVGLLISGAMVALALRKYKVQRIEGEHGEHCEFQEKIKPYEAFWGRVAPRGIAAIFSWWLCQQLLRHPLWWNPLEAVNPMTMLVQWCFPLAAFLLCHGAVSESTESDEKLE